ncbi:DUF6042 family protein [Kibdelosporangium philippinense]|uniref:DUF6042 family protein n=1 Tax=Kibdelosporangium philippinense TaxID=211113 RepID=A0ABS8ZXZ2_9PSEU|nr:DUF6042 family protein [Kibdelosporangium philippinense]MCE7011448.1 DUF6042 family protein [Kibdelosporangium philippinense]
MALLETYLEDEYLPEYGLIVLRDTPVEGSWPELPESVLNENGSAAGRIGTFAGSGNSWLQASAGDGEHTVTLESHDSEPPEDGSWDDIAETLYRSWSGVVGFAMLTGSAVQPDLRLSGPGVHRVRVARRKGEDFGDTWRLQFWPSPVAPPRWLKRGSPAVPEPDSGWSTVFRWHIWELLFIMAHAAGSQGATVEEVAAWGVEHQRPADWLEERLFTAPAGRTDLEKQAAEEEATIAGYAAQLGVPAPVTRLGLLTFFVAAGLLTFDGSKYRLVTPQPLAREVLTLPSDLIASLAIQSDLHQFQSFARDIAAVAAWLDRPVPIDWLAEQLLATPDEVRATLHHARSAAMLKVTGDDLLSLEVLPV